MAIAPLIIYPTVLVLLALTLPQPGQARPDSLADLPACSLEQLANLPWSELERIYRGAAPGTVPSGFARGRVVYPPETPLAGIKAGTASWFWRGKHFCATESTLVNQWLGLRAIRARTGTGPSWLDGRPALILDYADTSWWWRDRARRNAGDRSRGLPGSDVPAPLSGTATQTVLHSEAAPQSCR